MLVLSYLKPPNFETVEIRSPRTETEPQPQPPKDSSPSSCQTHYDHQTVRQAHPTDRTCCPKQPQQQPQPNNQRNKMYEKCLKLKYTGRKRYLLALVFLYLVIE